MPDLSGSFLTLAEIGVGLAGFSGIVLALIRRDAPLTPAQAVFVRELILNSLAVVFLALLPVGLALIGQQEPSVWRALSSFHVGLIVVVAWPSLFLQIRGVEPRDRDRPIYSVVIALQILTVAVQLLNATGLLFEPAGGVYFVGILGPLAIGAIHFARLLLGRLV